MEQAPVQRLVLLLKAFDSLDHLNSRKNAQTLLPRSSAALTFSRN